MTQVVQNLGTFMTWVLVAVFVQNAVFTRGFGVSRLTKLMEGSATDSLIFCALLTLVQVISAPMSYVVNQLLNETQFWYRDYIRPLGLVICALIAFGIVLVVITLLRLPNRRDLIAVLPLATLSCAVLGPMLISSSQNHSFVETIGFAAGSGLGYGLAVIMLSEGLRKMNSRKVPSLFRGLPINLLYIGILALAIFGLTGHMAIF